MNIHIYPSVFANETRILKIVRSLRRESVFPAVSVIALWKENLPTREVLEDGIEVLRVAPIVGAGLRGGLGRVVKVLGWYLGVLRALKGRRVACVNCHSLPVLPLSALVKLWKGAVLIYDPHELETETAGLRGLRQRIARTVERSLIGAANAVCAVNRSIADWYETAYRIRDVHVVRNVPRRRPVFSGRTGLLRQAVGLGPDARLFLYQGLLAPGRGVDFLIEAFSKLSSDQHLVLMGYGELADRIKMAAERYVNIHYMPAVSPDILHRYTVDADVGISLIEDVCLSYRLCLPNKLFEYAACGVPSIVSDFPEMGNFVSQYDCGWRIAPSTETLVALLSGLTAEEIVSKRNNALRASDDFSWQDEEESLLSMYRGLGFSGLAGLQGRSRRSAEQEGG